MVIQHDAMLSHMKRFLLTDAWSWDYFFVYSIDLLIYESIEGEKEVGIAQMSKDVFMCVQVCVVKEK